MDTVSPGPERQTKWRACCLLMLINDIEGHEDFVFHILESMTTQMLGIDRRQSLLFITNILTRNLQRSTARNHALKPIDQAF